MRLHLSDAIRSAVVLFALYVALSMAWKMLPNGNGLVGYDYNYYLPYLLAGEQWIRANGWLSPAHFTSAFCGGMPWLANPESMTWSLPQLLFNAVGPIDSIRWTFAAMVGVGAAGIWLLLRRAFRASPDACVLGAVLFLLNGFLLYRMAIGHLTYHVFGLAPGLAWLILWDENQTGLGAVGFFCRCIISGAILAAMVYAGAPNFVLPVLLSVCALILMRQTRTGLLLRPWFALAVACLWSIPLAAIKLVPAAIFILHYPRTYLNNGLFSDPLRMMNILVRAFMLPETLPASISLGPDRIVLGKHEFEYGLTIIPFALMAAAMKVRRNRRSANHPVIWVVLFVVLVLPLILTVGGVGWEHILASVPIINNNTVMTRWWAIEIMPIIVTGSLCFDSLARATVWRPALLVIVVAISAIQSSFRSLDYYTEGQVFPLYTVAGVAAAHAALQGGRSLPPTEIIAPAPAGVSAPMDGLLFGISSVPCYEAAFGYNSEWMPPNLLRPGPVGRNINGSFNIVDPRCYLSVGDEECHPGTLLPATEAATFVAFTNYRPIFWPQPVWQTAATLATVSTSTLSLIAVSLAAIAVCLQSGLRRMRRMV